MAKSTKSAKSSKAAAKTTDNARKVAKASDGKLDAAQVRILRALKNGKEVDRAELKELVGIGRDGKYSQAWLTSLWGLTETKPAYMSIVNSEETGTKTYHQITAAGKAALEKAEKAFKAAE